MLFGPLCVRKFFFKPSEGCVYICVCVVVCSCVCVVLVGTPVLACLSVCVGKLLNSVCVVFECSKCVCACVRADFS